MADPVRGEVRENGLSKTSGADAFQLRSLSLGRFVSKMGFLMEAELDAIADAIALWVKAKMKPQDHTP